MPTSPAPIARAPFAVIAFAPLRWGLRRPAPGISAHYNVYEEPATSADGFGRPRNGRRTTLANTEASVYKGIVPRQPKRNTRLSEEDTQLPRTSQFGLTV